MPAPPDAVLNRLKVMTASTTDPGLSDDELTWLLEDASLTDSAGRVPSDVAWVPTYNLALAAANGWEWKAGKTSDLGNIRTGDLTIEDNPIYEHCLKQAELYRAKLSWSASLVNRDYASTTTVTG